MSAPLRRILWDFETGFLDFEAGGMGTAGKTKLLFSWHPPWGFCFSIKQYSGLEQGQFVFPSQRYLRQSVKIQRSVVPYSARSALDSHEIPA